MFYSDKITSLIWEGISEIVPTTTTNFQSGLVTIGSIYTFLFIITTLTQRKTLWAIFTRIFSTFNAFQCVYMVYLISSGQLSKPMGSYMNLLEWGDDYVVRSLSWFAAYLFVDGGYLILHSVRRSGSCRNIVTNLCSEITSLLHHFVGGYGIYLIATERMGLGLGIYFAFTEISTPLLNISWGFHRGGIKNFLSLWTLVMFWTVFGMARIYTIPNIILYIRANQSQIESLNTIHQSMTYGGAAVLCLLNFVWFLMITRIVLSYVSEYFNNINTNNISKVKTI